MKVADLAMLLKSVPQNADILVELKNMYFDIDSVKNDETSGAVAIVLGMEPPMRGIYDPDPEEIKG